MVLLIQCKDRVGLVADISRIFAQRNLNIISMREFVDTEANYFFTRIVSEEYEHEEQLQRNLEEVLPADAKISINPVADKKVILLVTKEHHCLSDILVRDHFKTLGASIQCVIGNHDNLRNICNLFNVPFYHVSHENKTKDEFEEELQRQINQHAHDYLVLAKFMRILSPDFISRYPGRIINIHHSFLPAFVGANPYRQAHSRGVKIIGATAHFVTNELDEGPIIEQQVIHVNHAFSVADMTRAGMEVEKNVLAEALKLVFEDRVFLFNNKTVVFE